MATLTFLKIIFSQIKVSLTDRVGAHVKNASPQIGDSAGDFENQVWTLVEENEVFNWSTRGCLNFFFKQCDLVCMLDLLTILTCLIALHDHLIVCSLQHDSLPHMLDRTLFIWYLSVWYDCLLHDDPCFCMIVWLLVFVHYLTLDLRFFGCTCILHYALQIIPKCWEMKDPSPLGNPLGKQGSACVEVMTTLHGSIPSPWRRAEGCIPSEGTIASARDPLTHPFCLIEPPQPYRLA